MNLKLKHKRLYALLVALCLMLSVAVLLTACKVDKGNDDAGDNSGNNGTPDTPTYEGGPEQGTYYYNVAGGEETLVLSAGRQLDGLFYRRGKSGRPFLSGRIRLFLIAALCKRKYPDGGRRK